MDLPEYPCSTQRCSEEPGPGDGEDFERKQNQMQKSFHPPSDSSSAPDWNRMKKMSYEWTFAKLRPQITRTFPLTSQCHQQPVITKGKEQGGVWERQQRERENESLCYGKRVTVSLMKCTVILSQVLGGPRESPNGKIEKQSKTELSRGSVCFFMLHQHVEY